MNFMEATIHAIQEALKEASLGEGIDEYWENVFPEALDFAANEIFLTLNRVYINEPMTMKALRIAEDAPPRSIHDLDDTMLMLHYGMRVWLLRVSARREYQTLVDQSYSVIYDTSNPTRWVKPSPIRREPNFDEIVRKVYFSLVERYRQLHFAQRCRDKLVTHLQRGKYAKRTFILLHNSHGMRQEQNESIDWLRNDSRGIATSIGAAPDVGEDALQNHLNKLLALPLHLQVQRCGATGKAIKDSVIDIKRQAGRYEHVYLNDERHNPEELLNPNADELTEDPSERMIAGELPQRLLECQAQIEEILSQGCPAKGERRFLVLMELLVQTPQKEIAEQLNTSEATICRDRKIIEQSKERIEEVLYG